MAITVYIKDNCPHCAALRRDLDHSGYHYDVVDIGTSPEVVAELLKLTGGKRVVPVLVDGVTIKVAPTGGSEF